MATSGGERIGVDSGGTFTDVVRLAQGRVDIEKVPSTPDDPGRAVLDGLARLSPGGDARVVHGTTVATNAILTRTGGPAAFVTTKGFRDVLEIGRQDRRKLYSLEPEGAPCLVPRSLRFEVDERTLPDGSVETPVDEAALERLAEALETKGISAVALGFLHSYARSTNERRAAAILRKRGLLVSASSEVLPEYREYERFSTTAINAYVAPMVARYLTRLARRLSPTPLSVMQSNGGIASHEQAVRVPARTVLSGPAGGVAAAASVARETGRRRIVTLDMGGTSTDVSLQSGDAAPTTEYRIDGLPLALPVLDILTVGAGGGSIARVDAGGALAVGPESAAADPGPVCYGRGGRDLTVTDAHVFLGRLPPAGLLAGRMPLDRRLLDEPFRRLAAELGATPRRAALGILAVAEANMERAIRRMSLERGHDPAEFTLVAFGGAGGLHAVSLARAAGMSAVLVPPDPGAFSARGMAAADVVMDASAALLRPLSPRLAKTISSRLARLRGRLARSMDAEGFADPRFEAGLDLRYRGQSFEIPVSLADERDLSAARAAFEAAHERLYHARHPDREIEVVTVRLKAVGEVGFSGRTPAWNPKSRPAGTVERALAVFEGGELETTYLDRSGLRPGDRVPGPAVIAEGSGTTVVPPGFTMEVDEMGNLLCEFGGGEAEK